KYMREHAGTSVPMPEGPKIFETVGPWEDYATPSRDMRLIIAMNVLLGLPERVERHPELFVLGGRKPAELRPELQRLHERPTSAHAWPNTGAGSRRRAARRADRPHSRPAAAASMSSPCTQRAL